MEETDRIQGGFKEEAGWKANIGNREKGRPIKLVTDDEGFLSKPCGQKNHFIFISDSIQKCSLTGLFQRATTLFEKYFRNVKLRTLILLHLQSNETESNKKLREKSISISNFSRPIKNLQRKQFPKNYINFLNKKYGNLIMRELFEARKLISLISILVLGLTSKFFTFLKYCFIIYA